MHNFNLLVADKHNLNVLMAATRQLLLAVEVAMNEPADDSENDLIGEQLALALSEATRVVRDLENGRKEAILKNYN